jgi:hypothetical protein
MILGKAGTVVDLKLRRAGSTFQLSLARAPLGERVAPLPLPPLLVSPPLLRRVLCVCRCVYVSDACGGGVMWRGQAKAAVKEGMEREKQTLHRMLMVKKQLEVRYIYVYNRSLLPLQYVSFDTCAYPGSAKHLPMVIMRGGRERERERERRILVYIHVFA